MARRTVALFSLALVAAGTPLLSMFVMPEIRRVPVARLVENFERQLKSKPDDVSTLINLARLHGMAYALKTEQAETHRLTADKSEQPWYGFEQKHIPYEVKTTSSEESRRRAATHLAAAIVHYRRALELEPGNLLARLGFGWMLDQSGKRADAIREYRRVIDDAWREEQSRKHRMLMSFFTEEASEYLIRLLDPVNDAAEIAELKRKQAVLDRLPRTITPIALPLSDDLPAERFADMSARVLFDADGSGFRRRWSWISREAGWLVYDADGRGEITSALQWFGNVTFWLFWKNGYEALAALDDNADGELTGPELSRLAIWQDVDSDGRSDAGEVKPLSAHGIVALSCRSTPGDGVRFAAVSSDGVRFADGRTRPTYDVILRRAPEPTF